MLVVITSMVLTTVISKGLKMDILLEIAADLEKLENDKTTGDKVLAKLPILLSTYQDFASMKICQDDIKMLEQAIESNFITSSIPLQGFSIVPTNFGKPFVMDGLSAAIVKTMSKWSGVLIEGLKKLVAKLVKYFKTTKPAVATIKDDVNDNMVTAYQTKFGNSYFEWLARHHAHIQQSFDSFGSSLSEVEQALASIEKEWKNKEPEYGNILIHLIKIDVRFSLKGVEALFPKQHFEREIFKLKEDKTNKADWVKLPVIKKIANFKPMYDSLNKEADRLEKLVKAFDDHISKVINEFDSIVESAKEIKEAINGQRKSILIASRNLVRLTSLYKDLDQMQADAAAVVNSKA